MPGTPRAATIDEMAEMAVLCPDNVRAVPGREAEAALLVARARQRLATQAATRQQEVRRVRRRLRLRSR